MKARLLIVAILISVAIAVTVGIVRRDKDLRALETTDRAVIDQFRSAKTSVIITDADALKRLRAALVVRNVPPSAGMIEYDISFYDGKQLVRKVWVYPDGEWGFYRAKPPHWTTGSNPALKTLLDELAGSQ